MLDYEIAPAEANQKLVEAADAHPEFPPVLLDVREPSEFDAARVDGSKLMPMGDVAARAHQELDPDQPIFVLCHHGVRSMNVTMWLRRQGFENAQSVAGGIDRWTTDVDPTIPRY
jgi:rhodanese-related sulfurtransferase